MGNPVGTLSALMRQNQNNGDDKTNVYSLLVSRSLTQPREVVSHFYKKTR